MEVPVDFALLRELGPIHDFSKAARAKKAPFLKYRGPEGDYHSLGREVVFLLIIFFRSEHSRLLASLGNDFLFEVLVIVKGMALPVRDNPGAIINNVGILPFPYISTIDA